MNTKEYLIKIKTKEEFKKIMIFLKDSNYRWISGGIPRKEDSCIWNVFKERTYIHLDENKKISYGTAGFSDKNDMISFNTFIKTRQGE